MIGLRRSWTVGFRRSETKTFPPQMQSATSCAGWALSRTTSGLPTKTWVPRWVRQKKYDSYTETRLEQWVQAKRDKDFSTADAIRAELRAKGVEPDLVRPSDKDGNMQAMPVGMVGASAMQYGASSFQQPGFAMAGQMYPQGHGYQMMEPMMLPGAAPMGATSYDAETEAQLDRWVQAKREKDFITSDALRMALRAKSIEPDKARPSDKDGNWHSDVGSATKRFRGS